MKMESYLRVIFCLCWCATLSCSAVLPHHLYAGLPAVPQAVGWRESAAMAAAASRSDPRQRLVSDNSETYGYVDRFPTAERANHQFVFGVPHRFSDNYPSPYESLLSATASDYDSYDNGQYFVPPAYYRAPEPELNKRAMRYTPYDFLEEDADIGQNDYQQAVGPSQEDVINFQKYIQRYFTPGRAEAEAWNAYDDLTVDYPAVWQEEASTTEEPVYNDEEAAIQLQSLLPPRPDKAARNKLRTTVKDVQKKSIEATTTSTTTTTASTPTAKSSVTSAANVGQKEEPLLRPPTPSRHLSPAAASTVKPEVEDKAASKSIVDTIRRLFEMRNQVQDVEDELPKEGRMKRFVSQEDTLMGQLHSLDKVKA